ncbi:MAG: metallopeptidase TldD-related protein [Firmicutes bacterium]|nr:metallopeptidase TldD-related protein [Bacillota bacterium]
MDKEFLINKSSSITLNITAGKIDSYRRKEETTGTVRVYSDGKIGVAGALGEPDEEALTKQAEEALSLGIPYPCALDGAEEREELYDCEIIPEKDIVPVMQSFLDRVGADCPKFALSNKISLYHGYSEYRNSKGRHLVSSNGGLNIELIFQNRGSGNLFDGAFIYSGREFNPDILVSRFRAQYEAYNTQVGIESGVYPVVIDVSDLFVTFIRNFIGEMYVSGASLVSGKLGEKIFSEKLSLYNDRNPSTQTDYAFFDTEGQVAPDYRAAFIENGILRGVLTTKNSASQYDLPVFKSSDAAYDGVPSVGLSWLYASPTAKDLHDLVPGKSVYVVIASGGDTTPDGHFATPVQLAYLMEDGKPVGRLPELNVSGNFFEILGEGYLGTVKGYPNENSNLCVTTMQVTKN